jgi:sulfonate dioxygenase
MGSLNMAPGFTRRIVGVPKAESDAILSLIFHQISENPDFQVRFKWEKNSIAFWVGCFFFLGKRIALTLLYIG